VSAEIIAAATFLIWLYLVLGRGMFWRCAERDDSAPAGGERIPESWPSVTAVIPARNEADVIGRCVGSLLRQTYPGGFNIVLVDDQSNDGTADAARAAAREVSGDESLTVIRGAELPSGWTGKLWAMQQGFERAAAADSPPDFILFTDADIAYRSPDALERMVRIALEGNSVLTSVMVKLRCESFAERMLVPAFVFFFQMLYPFGWVNDPRRKTAAAAGGCMLVQRDALTAAGGPEKIRGALIDDCAPGALLKQQGPIWLGLTEQIVSFRPYPEIDDIRRMVARSAYAELRYSPFRLAGTLLGMGITYLAPPLLVVFADGLAQALGAVAWGLMALSFLPILRLYRRNPMWALALPIIALFYTGFTIDSAIQHRRGRGGAWKGRFQALEGARLAHHDAAMGGETPPLQQSAADLEGAHLGHHSATVGGETPPLQQNAARA
jgi:hopene-associated glycosyltransferase HpnB